MDIRESFMDFMGYEPPKLVAAVRIEDKNSPDPLEIFNVWLFRNPEALNINQWYEKYWYYPYNWGHAVDSVVESKRPKNSLNIDGMEAKYAVLDSMGRVQYIYLERKGIIYLIAVRGEPSSDEIGNQILSTFRFTDQNAQ